MKGQSKKFLLLGAKGYERDVDGVRVECVPWEHLTKIANIRDYDTILLNLFPLEAEEQRNRIDWQHFHTLFSFNAATDILLPGGRIIFLGDPRFDVLTPNIHLAIEPLPFLNWTGIQFQWDKQPGDTVNFEEDNHTEFKGFVRHLREWKYSADGCNPNRSEITTRFDLKNLADQDYQIAIETDYFCRNRYRNAVAFRVRLYFAHGYDRYKNQSFGWLVFLPRISLDEDETLQLILRDICEVETNLPEPEWLAQFRAPSQDTIDAKIDTIETEIRAKLAELEAAKLGRAKTRRCLKLLYEREFGLEPIVHEILAELGAKVEEPIEKNKEDGWITVTVDGETHEGVLEIKSTKSDQFGEDGRKQLLDWIDRGRTLREKNYKGIFIGNSAVIKPVGNRPGAFSDSWKKAAVLSHICAIKTEHLFELYVLHKQGKLNVDRFWTQLFNTDGMFDASPLLQKVSTAT